MANEHLSDAARRNPNRHGWNERSFKKPTRPAAEPIGETGRTASELIEHQAQLRAEMYARLARREATA